MDSNTDEREWIAVDADHLRQLVNTVESIMKNQGQAMGYVANSRNPRVQEAYNLLRENSVLWENYMEKVNNRVLYRGE